MVGFEGSGARAARAACSKVKRGCWTCCWAATRRACCAFTRRVALSTHTMRPPVTCQGEPRRFLSALSLVPGGCQRLAGDVSESKQRDAHLGIERAAVPRLVYSENPLNPRHHLHGRGAVSIHADASLYCTCRTTGSSSLPPRASCDEGFDGLSRLMTP